MLEARSSVPQTGRPIVQPQRRHGTVLATAGSGTAMRRAGDDRAAVRKIIVEMVVANTEAKLKVALDAGGQTILRTLALVALPCYAIAM